jgi:putative membrane protein
VLCGIVTGLAPGIHLNTFIPVLSGHTGLVGFVVGVVISHSFFDFFPSIFLGVPEESTALSVLPAHRMVLKGKAVRAFQLALFGGLFSSLLALCMIPFLFCLSGLDLRLPVLLILLFTAALMLLSAKNKAMTLAVFVMAGLLGVNTLGQPNALLALFSGFFGASTIVYSILNKPRVPAQEETPTSLPKAKPVFFGSIAGLMCGLLPTMSSSVSGIILQKLGRLDDEDFLVVLGAANTVYTFAALYAIFIVGKPRSGAGLLVWHEVEPLALLGSVLLALGLSAFLAFALSGRVVELFNRLPLRLLNVLSLLLVTGLNVYFNVFPLFALSCCLGLVCVFSGVNRNTCMASLLLPTILYYLA